MAIGEIGVLGKCSNTQEDNLGKSGSGAVMQKHPALAMRAVQDRGKSAIAEIRDSPEWQELGENDRHFLTLYILTRDARVAAERAGLSLTWMEDRERESAGFRQIVETVVSQPRKLVDALILEMVPYSLVKLQKLITQDRNQLVQLNAVKHLHALAQMIHGEGAVANQLVNINVTPWETEGKVTGKIVDVD